MPTKFNHNNKIKILIDVHLKAPKDRKPSQK